MTTLKPSVVTLKSTMDEITTFKTSEASLKPISDGITTFSPNKDIQVATEQNINNQGKFAFTKYK